MAKILMFAILVILMIVDSHCRTIKKGRLKMRFEQKIQGDVCYGQNVVLICRATNFRRLGRIEGIYKGNLSENAVKLVSDGIKYKKRSYMPQSWWKETYEMVIYNFEAKDEGIYSCKRRNLTASITIRVQGKEPKRPPAKFLAKTYHVLQGSPVSLFCVTKKSFNGFFHEKIGFNRQIDRNIRNIDDGKDFITVRAITLPKAFAYDSGRYYCRSGNFVASTNLKVHKYETDPRKIAFFKNGYRESVEYRVEIACKKEANLDVNLYHAGQNGVFRSLNEKDGVKKYSQVLVLTIKNVKPKHAGYYLCRDNKYAAMTTLDVHVEIPSKSRPTPKLKAGEDGVVTVNLKDRQERIVGRSRMLRWAYFGNESWNPLNPTNITRLASMYGDFRGTKSKRYKLLRSGALLIRNVTKKDAGYYAFSHGNDGFKSFLVNVEE